MEGLWKAAGIVVVTAILSGAIEKKGKDIATALTAVACCGVACLGIRSLSGVVAFLWKIGNISEYQYPFVGTILKITGAAVITEMTALISMDAGCSSLEKAMLFLGNATILSLALPIFESFADIVQEILRIV